MMREFGGIEGPNSQYVKLMSSDGMEFIVKRDHALTSGTIKAMLSGPGQFSENENNEINFREIPSHVLQKICMYFTYKLRYRDSRISNCTRDRSRITHGRQLFRLLILTHLCINFFNLTLLTNY